jgi:hypothetical protein
VRFYVQVQGMVTKGRDCLIAAHKTSAGKPQVGRTMPFLELRLESLERVQERAVSS